jgi:hypothetical protein
VVLLNLEDWKMRSSKVERSDGPWTCSISKRSCVEKA